MWKLMISTAGALLLSGSVLLVPSEEVRAEDDVVRLNVAFAQPIPLPPFSFLYVGTHLGHFEEEGLEVEYVWARNSTIGLQQLVSGNVDVFVGAYDSVLTRAAADEDLGLQAIYSYQRGNQSSVIVLDDSEVQGFADLEGKILGVPTLASAYTINTALAGLAAAGVSEDSVEMVAVGVGLEAAAALTSRRVDATAQVDTSVAQIINAGIDIRRLDNAPDVATISAMITARRDFIEENREILQRYVRAITKGNIFFTENPEAAVRIAWHLYPEIKPTDLSEEEAVKAGIALIAARAANQRLEGGEIPMWGAASETEWANYLKFLNIEPGPAVSKDIHLNESFLEPANDFDIPAYTEWVRAYQFSE